MAGKGRPTKKAPDVLDAVCNAVSVGTTLTDACREQGISRDAWDNWVNADAELNRRFARARECGHDAIASRLRETARGRGESTDDVQRDKLIIETDLKLLAKWDRRYADKVDHSHSGAIGLEHNIDVTGLTPDQLRALASIPIKETP